MRLFLACLAVLLTAPAAFSQAAPVRLGVGLDVVAIPLRAGDVDPGLGLGLRGRAALPINADLSAAGSLGITANLAGSAVLTAAPQVSMIVTLPNRSSYVLGGFGGFVPLSGGGGGPTVHAGFGVAVPLSETSIYFEVDPAIVVGSSETTFVIPGRVGVIF
ncbi:MAG: hypothetical protein AAGI52_00800 [Bacteroidota bacterium]